MALCSFTSDYLRRLICERNGVHPPIGEVFYNGVPEEWVERVKSDEATERRSDEGSEAEESSGSGPSVASSLRRFVASPELLTVGNVSPYKGQERIIRLMPQVLVDPRLDGLVYRIVGHCDEPYRRRLEALITRLGLGKQVILEGPVSDARLAEAYAGARAFVLASVCESFGIPLIEAMSFGTPCLALRAAALPEICGDAAELVDPADDTALAAALVRILTDEPFAEALRRRGFERVQHFNWRTTAERMAAALGEWID